MVMGFSVGDVLSMKKQHPCGSWEWEVTRLGADLGIRCLKCHRYVLMVRSTLERRVRAVVSPNKSPVRGHISN